MLLQEGKILSTAKTPEIILNSGGSIIIKGRWSIEDNANFSKVLSDWYDKYIFDLPEVTKIDIRIEYFSGLNLFILISLLRKISCIKLIRRKLTINWYYEEGDEDILEIGEYISSVLDTAFNYILIPDNKLSVNFAKTEVEESNPNNLSAG